MSVGSFGRPNPAANRPRGDSPVRVPVGQSGSSSSRGPWNPMMAPASVHLPLANSTQEDLEIFRGVEAALTDQAAQTQYQGTLATDADSTQHRYLRMHLFKCRLLVCGFRRVLLVVRSRTRFLTRFPTLFLVRFPILYHSIRWMMMPMYRPL